MKKIVFFDGDGTLWYPKKTKWKSGPWEIYKSEIKPEEHHIHLVLTPSIISTLRKLRRKGITTIILSTHPHKKQEAKKVLERKIKHFGLINLFDEFHATRTKKSSKGEFIERILNKRGISKKQAIMIGDSYKWDYQPARKKGIDALIIETPYNKRELDSKRVKNRIKKLGDIFKYVH